MENKVTKTTKRKKSKLIWIFLRPVALIFCVSIINGKLIVFYKKHFSDITYNNQSSEKFSHQGSDKIFYPGSKKNEQNNYSNQKNPNTDIYWKNRGYIARPENWKEIIEEESFQTQNDLDNRSNQLNPNNDLYWQSRGYNERPDSWEKETSNSSSTEMDNHANQMNPNNEAYSASRR
nr:hypothetical protein [uncultured Flavobacterium sp.]